MTDRLGVRKFGQGLRRSLGGVPSADVADPLASLVAQGRLRRGTGDLAAIVPLTRPVSRDASSALAEDRDESVDCRLAGS